ncbi:hypothetical protein [Mesorhizobium sp.]|uniref:hypothetical protein n=1 Tax=Mesorhizobium sp. TaxID=1871066 RepID=UPI000FE722D6|nr:hypothetical protein [Mesorhizobium sp.]RWB66577.1 MAG: hypothetical protein EOQ49_28205 [Mesorhizobium sp.]
MGRLFWPFERAMKTDCVAIIMALEAQDEFLRRLFGPGEAAPPKPEELPKLTPAALASMGRRILRPPKP